MCTNTRFILNRYTGRHVLVSCGTCPSCLQSKAVSRTNKIKAQHIKDGNMCCLFITLTYKTQNVPYFHYVDLDNSPLIFNFANKHYKPKYNYLGEFPVDSRILDDTALRVEDKQDYRFVKHTTIRRDVKPHFVKVGRSRRLYLKHKVEILDDLYLGEFEVPRICRFLRGQSSDKVGVCYFKDLQDFFKRLRNVLQRNFGVKDKFAYFCCSEYGPTTHRPHFHILLWCPRSLREVFKAATCASWPFADFKRTYEHIEEARDAASYVSSYVNCDSSIPPLFKTHKQIRPKHSHSLHFGQNLDYMQFPKVLEAVRRGDLHVVVQRMRKGTIVDDTILLPKYVTSRYFPYFKGCSRLTFDALELVYFRPSAIYQFYEELGLSLGDAPKIITRLNHARDFAVSHGVGVYDYAFLAARSHYVRAQNILSDFYTDVVPSQKHYAYDNIKDLFDMKVSSPSLEEFFEVDPPPVLVLDQNLFPERVASSLNLRTAYYSYSKDKKIRNKIYSNFDIEF